MGKFSSIFRRVGKLFQGLVGAESTPTPTPILKKEKEGEDTSIADAARRTRAAASRRRGRRASILSSISEEEVQSASINRPGAGALAKTFGG